MYFTTSHRHFARWLWRVPSARALAMLLAASPAALLFAAAPPGARPGNGSIAVTTQPGGATIYIDGQPSGKTPGEVEGLGPGRYFVRMELAGYRPAELVVDLSSGQSYHSPTIELVSSSAPRRVEAAPPAPAPPPEPRHVASTPPPAPPPEPRHVPAVPAPPAPGAAPATPSPAPVAAATPIPVPVRAIPPPIVATPAPAPAATGGGDEAIQALVSAHLKAIEEGDIPNFLRLCAPKVDYYDEGILSHDGIRKIRQKQKDRWPVYDIANVRGLSVRGTNQEDLKRAAVTYDWSVSNPGTGKKASGTANDVIDFKQVGGQWLIVKTRQSVDRNKSRQQ